MFVGGADPSTAVLQGSLDSHHAVLLAEIRANAKAEADRHHEVMKAFEERARERDERARAREEVAKERDERAKERHLEVMAAIEARHVEAMAAIEKAAERYDDRRRMNAPPVLGCAAQARAASRFFRV